MVSRESRAVRAGRGIKDRRARKIATSPDFALKEEIRLHGISQRTASQLSQEDILRLERHAGVELERSVPQQQIQPAQPTPPMQQGVLMPGFIGSGASLIPVEETDFPKTFREALERGRATEPIPTFQLSTLPRGEGRVKTIGGALGGGLRFGQVAGKTFAKTILADIPLLPVRVIETVGDPRGSLEKGKRKFKEFKYQLATRPRATSLDVTASSVGAIGAIKVAFPKIKAPVKKEIVFVEKKGLLGTGTARVSKGGTSFTVKDAGLGEFKAVALEKTTLAQKGLPKISLGKKTLALARGETGTTFGKGALPVKTIGTAKIIRGAFKKGKLYPQPLARGSKVKLFRSEFAIGETARSQGHRLGIANIQTRAIATGRVSLLGKLTKLKPPKDISILKKRFHVSSKPLFVKKGIAYRKAGFTTSDFPPSMEGTGLLMIQKGALAKAPRMFKLPKYGKKAQISLTIPRPVTRLPIVSPVTPATKISGTSGAFPAFAQIGIKPGVRGEFLTIPTAQTGLLFARTGFVQPTREVQRLQPRLSIGQLPKTITSVAQRQVISQQPRQRGGQITKQLPRLITPQVPIITQPVVTAPAIPGAFLPPPLLPSFKFDPIKIKPYKSILGRQPKRYQPSIFALARSIRGIRPKPVGVGIRPLPLIKKKKKRRKKK